MDERRKDRSLPLRPSNAFYELLIEADGGEAGRCPCDRGWQEADRDLTDRVQRQRVSVHDHVQLFCHFCRACTDANPQNSFADDKYFGMFFADKPHLDATGYKIPELHRLKPSSQAEPKRAGPLDLHRAYTPLRSWTVRGPSAIVDSALAINRPRCAEATLFAEGPRLTDSYRRPGSWPHSLSHLAGPCIQVRGASVPACARSGLSEDQTVEERYEGC